MKLISNKIKYVWNGIFEEISVAEYVSWWVVRALLVYAVIMHTDPKEKVLCAVNTLALFALPIIRFIFPKKSVLGNLSFRAQHLINLMEFSGSFMGNFVGMYSIIGKYDRVLHAISGPVAVIGGYFVYKALLKKENSLQKLSPSMGTLFGTAFSFIIITIWEITEFFGDFLWGTCNQGYQYAPGESDIFFKIFGYGAGTYSAQFPLWDTMMDMLDASLTSFAAAVILFIILNKSTQKTSKLTEKIIVDNC